MAKEWNRGTWEDEIYRIVDAAVNERMAKRNTEGYSQEKINAIKKEMRNDGVARMKKDFGYSLKDTEKDVVSNWKAEDASNYLFGGGNAAYRNSFNPLTRKRMDDFAKLGPLVLGLADEGRDWYSMGQEDLFAEGKKLGYDTSTKEGKMDFLRDVADVQQAHDRGKMLEEFNRENSVWSDLFYPTLMEEARKQITTGRGTQEQLDNAKNLDIATNIAISAAPILGDLGRLGKGAQTMLAARKAKPLQALSRSPIFKAAEYLDDSPVISAAIGAGAQGALEAGRQKVKEEIDPDLEADYSNALLALTTGATRPGMIGTAGTIAQQFPGRGWSRFSRGVMSATRRGNPVNAEREELARGFDMYKELFRDAVNNSSRGATFPENAFIEPMRVVGKADNQSVKEMIEELGTALKLPDLEKANTAEKFVDKAKALYGDYADEFLANGTKKKLLSDYDDISKMTVHRNPDNFYKQVVDGYELVNGAVKPGDYLSTLQQAFPSKMAEAYGNDAAYKFGLRTGELLGTLGGSIEPAMKVNPLGPLSGGRLNIVNTDYKGTNWYKSLSKKQQEAFDDAYKKSKKEPE